MNQYPLIKINILFIIGIIIQSSLSLQLWILLILFSSLLILSIIFLLLQFNKIIPISLILLVTACGSLSYYYAASQLKDYPYKESRIRNAVVYGSIKDIQPAGSYELKFKIHSDSVKIADRTIQTNHYILCRIRDDHNALTILSDKLAPGNLIELKGVLSKAPGDRNPGEFNYYNYLHRAGISALFTTYDIEKVRVTDARRDNFKTLIFSAQKVISLSINRLLNKDAAALLKGLILADRTGIDPLIIEDFINSGVIHILSVSGLHIGYIVLIFMFLTGRMNFIYRVPLIIAGIILYTALTGAPPSVLRAAVMSIIIFLAIASNRSTNLLNTLSLTCLIFLMYNPMDLFHPGFQLSYTAVGSIALFYHFFGESFRKLAVKHKLMSGIAVFFLISFFAQLGTIPFTIYYFGKLSVVSLITNIFVIPATGVILGAGIFMLLLNIIWAAGAAVYASAVNLLVYLVYSVVHYFSGTRWAYLNISHFSIYDAVIFYFFSILMIVLIYKLRGVRSKIILIPLTALNIIIFSKIDDKELMPDNKLSVLAVDVGQGDAFLIKFPDGKTALIDAGETTQFFDNGKRVILPLLEHLGIKKIDYGFISHMDVDHYEGFISLIRQNKVGCIYKPAVSIDSDTDLRFESWLKIKNIPIVHYGEETIAEGNVRIYILNKTTIPESFNMNDRSGSIKVVFGKTSFLFTGDTEKKGEQFLIKNYGSFLKSNVLKLGHHGSGTGTSEEFLEAVKPEYGLISAGVHNRFNHPAPETLNRLNKRRIRELRTDLNGAILITSDGNNIEVVDWK